MYLRLQETEEQITAANMQGLQIKSKYSTLHAPIFSHSIYTSILKIPFHNVWQKGVQ